jgi:signal transduction histidine kinase
MAHVQLPRRTVRLRLALLYGGLFLISGTALLAVTYVLVRHAVDPPGGGDLPVRVPPESRPPLPPPPSVAGKPPTVQLSEIMQKLLINSGLALALMSVTSVALGWIVAGRMLRPLRTITAAARDISATSLHRRLAIEGPDDELKELGDTFDRLLDRLESSFQVQRSFVANASHELRTPLARQRALGQVALSDPDATVGSLRAAHERILLAGHHQERLIEALLTLTRGQAGIDVREPFDLAQLTQDVIDARRAEADCRAVTFRPAISPALVAGHRSLAERLVANLVDNALNYNTPHGWIDVATSTAAGRATLSVTNTGPLVPPDAVDDLFRPFHRLGTDRAAQPDGLGLGLSIVQAIADAHDATRTTTARPEGGLAITVAFPGIRA